MLINPPSPPHLTANREGSGGLGAWSVAESSFLYPPQALLYAAAALRVGGWRVSLIDAAGERLDSQGAIDRIEAIHPGVIVVQAAHISLDADVQFLNDLRAAAPHARLLAAGASMPFVEPHLLERTDVDHVMIGEPEAMLPLACRMLAGEGDVRRLRRRVTVADVAASGLDATKLDGEGRVTDLDALPLPAWDLVDPARYGFVTVATSRGCDDVCAFCPYVVGQGRHLRTRRAESVVDEMAWLARSLRPARVIMRDPVFASQRQRVERICEGLLQRHVRLSWECESRPEHFDAGLLSQMRRAGCTTIKLGVETTSEPVLRTLRRIPAGGKAGDYLAATARVAQACRDLGLACRMFVMTGLPGQTDEDVRETLAFLREARPSAVTVKAFHRYPGLDMPSADVDEERQRGEQQALLVARELHLIAPTSGGLLRRARRWLGRRIRA